MTTQLDALGGEAKPVEQTPRAEPDVSSVPAPALQASTEVVAAPPALPTFETLMQIALQSDVKVENLERMVALFNQERDRQAKQEFNAALARVQDECPSVKRESVAKVVSANRGTDFTYRYAELDEIANTVRPYLHQHGFSYSWDSTVTDTQLTCTCTLRHRNGHSETASFTCPTESRAGMSTQQKYGAALTYAKRQTLTQVLGITTSDPDTDAADLEQHEVIAEDQVVQIEDLLASTGADKAKFLEWARIESIDQLRQAWFARAVENIKTAGRIRAKKGGAS